jgi:hypothetical protein
LNFGWRRFDEGRWSKHHAPAKGEAATLRPRFCAGGTSDAQGHRRASGKEMMESRFGIKSYGAQGRDRTTDTAIFSYS